MVAIKISFCASTVLYCVAAIILVAGGCYYGSKMKEVTDLRHFETYQFEIFSGPQVMPWIYVAVGFFTLLVAGCGFCGAGTNSKEGLSIHIIFLSISICLFIVTAVTTMAVIVPESEHFINETIKNVFEQVKINKDLLSKFGNIQQTLPCCGANGYLDYMSDTVFNKKIPDSCCFENDQNCLRLLRSSNTNSRLGCIKAANMHWYRACVFGTIVCGLAAFFGLISLLTNVVLYKSMKKDDHFPDVKSVPLKASEATLQLS